MARVSANLQGNFTLALGTKATRGVVMLEIHQILSKWEPFQVSKTIAVTYDSNQLSYYDNM
ncbi:hypothetical protein MJO28_006953 [Puccinia striiformis f. sp. tritici]|uniref:Uncharacterized protein n=1 Tax=Puccinia striiformis f. sp. tritici TaxID=168172 RepID=A0ACC0EES6_9BASI|nr:hypothetical protein MJO28_006953 [Puccinia striiformis f. sp. tritici]